jgi:MutS domain V/MutS domain III
MKQWDTDARMTPSEQYSERLGKRQHLLFRFDRLHERLGVARLAAAAACLVVGWLCIARGSPPAWLLLSGSGFVALVLYHQHIRGLRGTAQRAVAFYRAGLERLQGHRRHGASTGEQYSDPHHLYAADLDLFGKQSLYEQLNTARTPMGEHALAGWLLAPADLETIRERQTCVAELRGRLDLREDLAVLGELSRIVLEPHAIATWLDAPNALSYRGLRAAAFALAGLAGAGAVVWGVWGISSPFLTVLVLEAGLNYVLRNRVQQCLSGIEHAYEDIRLLAALLRRIEAESFEASELRALRLELSSHSRTASVTLSKLATIVNFVEARRNPFLTPLMLPLMYTIHSALAAERWRELHGRAVAAWLRVLGEVEALESIAGHSFERPEDPFPEFVDGPASFRAVGLGHPLIAVQTRVRNDVELSGETRILLVSGSNMSGKSTLLRSVGMNTVLAMAGAPVCAARLQLTPLQVGASIRVNDSLYEGSSRFYAEITRLRQLFEPGKLPLLFLLDELLQGTNSTDRRIGAQGVLRALVVRGAIGLVSTHDLALADDPDLRRGALKNVHFQDELLAGKLSFDFRLRDGVVTKSNGIELMRAIGLDV